MKYHFLCIFLFFSFHVFAQDTEIKLQVPELVEAEVNEPVIFRINWSAPDKSKLNLTWKSDITTAKFDAQEKEFFWQPGEDESGLYKVTFFVKDSAGTRLEQASTLVKVNAPKSRPAFQLFPDSLDERPYIRLLQEGQYRMEFVSISPATRNQDDIILNYILDNNTDLKNFENSEFHILGNRLMVDWKPSQKQADKKYFEMELIAIDENNSVGRKKYRFQIIDRNIAPYLRNNINDTYIITAGQELEIDFSVIDPDKDPINYRLEIPITLGNPTISDEGVFRWKLSPAEMASISSVFPLEIKLIAQDMLHPDDYIERKITLLKSERNDPPSITKLANLSIREGYSIKRRVFIKDNNHQIPDLKFELDNEPEWLYLQQEGDRLYLMSDTIGFDIVKADGIPVQYDVMLTVRDPSGASDSEFFNVSVSQGVNTVEVYHDLDRYHKDTDALLVGLRKKINELDDKVRKNRNLKKGLLFTSFFLGTFSATGSFFEDYTVARQMVPYAGAMLAITSSVNALAFNQEGKISSLKIQLEEIEKKIVRNKSYLKVYDIENPTDDELRNSDLLSRLQSFRQSLIEQRIELERLEDEYMELNYVQRRIKRYKRRGKMEELKWKFINFN